MNAYKMLLSVIFYLLTIFDIINNLLSLLDKLFFIPTITNLSFKTLFIEYIHIYEHLYQYIYFILYSVIFEI